MVGKPMSGEIQGAKPGPEAGDRIYNLASDFLWKIGGKKGALATSALALIVSACGAVKAPKTPEVTLAQSTPTTEVTPTPTFEGPVGFVPGTPTSVTNESTPVVVPSETPGSEIIREPTLAELAVSAGEGGAVPDYAQPYYQALSQEKDRIASQLGVKAADINIYYKNNGLAQEASRWALWVAVKGKGVAWPVTHESKLLGDYPAYFELDNYLNPAGPVHFDRDYDWVLVGGPEARMTFAGTRPIVADKPGKALVNGAEQQVYSQYLRPGGVGTDRLASADTWTQVAGVETPTVLEIVNNEYDPEKLPYTEWDYAHSEQFLLDLKRADEAGKIPHAPDTAIFIEPGDVRPQFDFIKTKGGGGGLIFNLLRSYRYRDFKARPYTLAGAWQTELNGVPSVLIVLRWENSDGSAGYLGKYYPRATEEVANLGGGEAKNRIALFESFAGLEAQYYPNSHFFSSQSRCNQAFTSWTNSPSIATAMCEWQFKQDNTEALEQMYKNWEETGNLRNGNKIIFEHAGAQYIP